METSMKARMKALKKKFFSTPANTFLTLLLAFFLGKAFLALLDWAIFNSHWNTSVLPCREAEKAGACWSFLQAKARYILFGHYPMEEQWRPLLLMLTFFGLFFISQWRRFWSKHLLWAWAILPILATLVMWGGFAGLRPVDMEEWGGLPLTLILSFFGITISYPFGILLALARRSSLPILRTLSVLYIETIRGVPLISILFMSSVLFPLFLPQDMVISKVLRAQMALILFSAAYMAEVVRGGLQAIPRGQYEAAQAIGLNYPKMMGLIILPQSLKIVIPPTVNTFIGLFKDTSLVFIIALSDLMFTAKASFKDTDWLGITLEGYLFVAAIYFVFCHFMSQLSLRLEDELATS